jgi:hypothetical protein
MNDRDKQRLQDQWKKGYLPGVDGIFYGDGSVIIAHTYSTIDSDNKREYHWYPLCDTTIASLEKYEGDIWTPVDIWHGALKDENETIVFGDGAMGNEGHISSVDENGNLNWGLFSTFSNPICRAEKLDDHLICYGDNGIKITINRHCLYEITISEYDPWGEK